MESHRYSLRQRPLPGGRQGMSGAGAGHDSMRTTGGRRLNRRASPVQEATADSAAGAVSEPPSAQTPPAQSIRRRMKWSITHNRCIMKAYFIATRLETDLVGYRQEMFRLFREEFPEINVNEQRIADQRRVILRNKLLPDLTIANIRREVEDGMRDEVRQEESGTNIRFTTGRPSNTRQVRMSFINIVPDADNSVLSREVENAFQTARAEFYGMAVEDRPRVPTLGWSYKLTQAVKVLNDTHLVPYIAESPTFERVHEAVYLGSVAAARVCGREVLRSTDGLQTRGSIPAWQRRLSAKIDALRGDINRLIRYQRGERGKRLVIAINRIMRNAKIHGREDERNRRLTEFLDTLKQRLAVASKKLGRHKKSQRRRQDNVQFQRSERNFYRSLNNENELDTASVPEMNHLMSFWSQVWSPAADRGGFEGTPWLQREENAVIGLEEMEFNAFSTEGTRAGRNSGILVETV